MANPFVGEIRMGGWNFAPQGWGLCNGQLLSISQFEALFTLLGTTYGGDGQTTFGLPDLRGRVPVHQGPQSVMGQLSGSEEVTLNVSTMPTHNHLQNVANSNGTSAVPTANLMAIAPSGLGNVYGAFDSTAQLAASIGSTGSNQPHDNMMPYITVNFVISLFGIFPAQS
jgi:microcystin-dependent protein